MLKYPNNKKRSKRVAAFIVLIFTLALIMYGFWAEIEVLPTVKTLLIFSGALFGVRMHR